MFGWKRFAKDCNAFGKMTDLTEEQGFKEAIGIVGRFGRTNFIAGSLITAAGVVAGTLGPKVVEKIKEKKNKKKELKDTDK